MYNDTNAILAFERMKWGIEDLGAIEFRKILKRFASVKPGHDPIPGHHESEMTESLQENAIALNRAEAWDIAHYLQKDQDGTTKFNEVLIGSKESLNGGVDDVLMRISLNLDKDETGEIKIEQLQGKFHLGTYPGYLIGDMSKEELFEELKKEWESKQNQGLNSTGFSTTSTYLPNQVYSFVCASVGKDDKVKLTKSK